MNLTSSLRPGHETLRISDLTSRKYLDIRTHRVGFVFPDATANVRHILYYTPINGFLCERYEFYRYYSTFLPQRDRDRFAYSYWYDNSYSCIECILVLFQHAQPPPPNS